MNTFARIAIALVVGSLGFAVVAVGITAALEPWVAFSLIVGLPVGLSAGLTAAFATYAGLRYRDQVRRGSVSNSAVRTLWAGITAVLDFVTVTALGLTVYFLVDGSLGIGLLVVGLPVTLLLAAVAGYLSADTGREADDGSRFSAR
ncbi:hypothetical protein [Halogeometricum sp. CBA1124]|uniref:hypothetical protein n=1 Tax=Halogeometricum sp. CBA1124 TaxID=2668071 RepID=UPI0014290C7A|nr:hypothetical protein [Halogeometricum sp. CBA1124]MUV56325.1 hypothetical protein [Halogeometricum sp. CBA1124]